MDSEAGSALQSNTILHGRWRAVARAAWIVVALLAVLLYLVSIYVNFTDLARTCPTATCQLPSLYPQNLQELHQLGLSPRGMLLYFSYTDILSMFVYLVVAIFIFVRRSDDWMAILISLLLITFGVVTVSGSFEDITARFPGLQLPSVCLQIIENLAILLFFYLFPDGRFVPRWTRWLTLIIIPLGIIFIFKPALPASGPIGLILVASFLFAQTYRYWRVSNAVQREQTKWVVFGALSGVMVLVLFSLISSLLLNNSENDTASVFGALLGNTVFHMALLALPFSLAVAILRYRLFDIDFIIRRTLVYSTLTLALALAYFLSVAVLQELFQVITGQHQSPLATIVSTLVIAALFNPLRHRIQNVIDMRFYRHKYDAQRTLEAFASRVRDEVELEQLTNQLLSVVQETLQPEYVSLWLENPYGIDRRSSGG